MRKAFIIINIFCMILSVGLVSFFYISKLDSGKSLYSRLYDFATCDESDNLIVDLERCGELTEDVLGSTMSDEQEHYLYELSTVVEKLNSYQVALSQQLLFDNKKTVAINHVGTELDNLIEKRNQLLFSIDLYVVKMSGNTHGDPKGTCGVLITDVLNYLVKYGSLVDSLNEHIVDRFNPQNPLLNKLCDIYYNGVIYLSENYDPQTVTFINDSYNSIKKMNVMFQIDYNVIVSSSINGGAYSNVAFNFMKNLNECSIHKFAVDFYSLSNATINIDTETNEYRLAYYYLKRLMGVA